MPSLDTSESPKTPKCNIDLCLSRLSDATHDAPLQLSNRWLLDALADAHGLAMVNEAQPGYLWPSCRSAWGEH